MKIKETLLRWEKETGGVCKDNPLRQLGDKMRSLFPVENGQLKVSVIVEKQGYRVTVVGFCVMLDKEHPDYVPDYADNKVYVTFAECNSGYNAPGGKKFTGWHFYRPVTKFTARTDKYCGDEMGQGEDFYLDAYILPAGEFLASINRRYKEAAALLDLRFGPDILDELGIVGSKSSLRPFYEGPVQDHTAYATFDCTGLPKALYVPRPYQNLDLAVLYTEDNSNDVMDQVEKRLRAMVDSQAYAVTEFEYVSDEDVLENLKDREEDDT